jgi:acyl-CoA thioester hydrolase
MAEPLDLTKRESFVHFQTENVRFSDTDLIGHVNNVAFAALLESGRTAFAHSHLFAHLPDGGLTVMARVEIDYRRELHWPGRVDIGTCISAIGRSSYAMGQGIFLGESCFATGRTTIVLIDRETRRSTPLPGEFRRVLESLSVPQYNALSAHTPTSSM